MSSETVTRGISRVSTGVVDTILHRVRNARKDSANRKERVAAMKSGPSVQERQAELVRFYERYEDLVDTLCDGAQYGPTAKLERNYLSEREWMRQNYPALRPYVVSFLRLEPEDAQRGIMVSGRGTDAFEALVSAENLDELLRRDDGCMISRITRTREALTLYGEHLRQLAARTK